MLYARLDFEYQIVWGEKVAYWLTGDQLLTHPQINVKLEMVEAHTLLNE